MLGLRFAPTQPTLACFSDGDKMIKLMTYFLVFLCIYLSFCKPENFSFINSQCHLWIISILALALFLIPVLPSEYLKNIVLKIFSSYRKNLDANQLEKLYSHYHLEIKQTFTFSFAMFLSQLLLGKDETINVNSVLVIFSTVAVYTCLFAFFPFLKATEEEIGKANILIKKKSKLLCVLLLLLVGNLFLLYLGWNKQGDFVWTLSWICVIPVLYIQFWKISLLSEMNNTNEVNKKEINKTQYRTSNPKKNPKKRKLRE